MSDFDRILSKTFYTLKVSCCPEQNNYGTILVNAQGHIPGKVAVRKNMCKVFLQIICNSGAN